MASHLKTKSDEKNDSAELSIDNLRRLFSPSVISSNFDHFINYSAYSTCLRTSRYFTELNIYLSSSFNDKFINIIRCFVSILGLSMPELLKYYKLIANVAKLFLMSQNEIVYLFSLFERLKYGSVINLQLFEFAEYAAYSMKICLNTNIDFICDYIQICDPEFNIRYSNFMLKYNQVLQSVSITPIEVNMMETKLLALLKKSSHFQENMQFDSNLVVDSILENEILDFHSKRTSSILIEYMKSSGDCNMLSSGQTLPIKKPESKKEKSSLLKKGLKLSNKRIR